MKRGQVRCKCKALCFNEVSKTVLQCKFCDKHMQWKTAVYVPHLFGCEKFKWVASLEAKWARDEDAKKLWPRGHPPSDSMLQALPDLGRVLGLTSQGTSAPCVTEVERVNSFHPTTTTTRLITDFADTISDAEKRKLDEAVAKFWNDMGLPWRLLDTPQFHDFIFALRPAYANRGPIKSKAVSTTALRVQDKQVSEQFEERLMGDICLQLDVDGVWGAGRGGGHGSPPQRRRGRRGGRGHGRTAAPRGGTP